MYFQVDTGYLRFAPKISVPVSDSLDWSFPPVARPLRSTLLRHGEWRVCQLFARHNGRWGMPNLSIRRPGSFHIYSESSYIP